MNTLYETDIYAWSMEQIGLIKDRKFDKLDLDHLLQEIDGVGNNNRDAIKAHLLNIIYHLLKKEYTLNLSYDNNKSWTDSIDEARDQIYFIIEEVPSLQKYPETIIQSCYILARKRYSDKFRKEIREIPTDCIWTKGYILGE